MEIVILEASKQGAGHKQGLFGSRRLAFVRERALRDEVLFLNKAKREGHEEGLEQGREESRCKTARNLIRMNLLSDVQIAEAAGPSENEVKALRAES